MTPSELAVGYFEVVDAPHKELVWFEHSVHSPHLEEPDRFAQVLMDLLDGRLQ